MTVLILGVPRSGTTWLGQMLASTPGARYVHEPDNELISVAAARAKRRLGRFPVLAPGATAPEYARLWDRALHGEPGRLHARLDRLHRRFHKRRLAPWYTVQLGRAAQIVPFTGARERPIIKTVHAALSAAWVVERVQPARVIVLMRDPLNVIASSMELRMPDADRGLDRDPRFSPTVPLSTPLHRMAWQCGILHRALLDAAARHPDWIVRSHEDLIIDPIAEIPAIASAAGLDWQASSDELLRASNKTGVGHHTTREWTELKTRWRKSLSEDDAAIIREVVDAVCSEPVADG